jgi:hypothetical protein
MTRLAAGRQGVIRESWTSKISQKILDSPPLNLVSYLKRVPTARIRIL